MTGVRRLSADEAKRARAELDRVLESAFFHGSERSSRFLQYSVEKVLSGCNEEELKERIIGIEIFNRDPGYDTTRDSTVRVSANEVRKRLAQYYSKALADDPVIELPTGSYAVTFRWKSRAPSASESPQKDAAPQPEEASAATEREGQRPDTGGGPKRARRLKLALLLAAILVAACAAGAIVYLAAFRDAGAQQQVWSSLLNSRNDTLICVAAPPVYRLWPDRAQSGSSGPSNQMVPLPNAVIGIGDAYALANFTSFLTAHNKAWYLRSSESTSFRDLTAGPVILIGSFSNPWANRLMGGLRYVFVEGPPNRLVDRSHPENGWTIQVNPDWTATEDYAVVSRFQSPDTGETIIAVAGATNFGTEAAGEFVTSRTMLAEALKDAPKDWKSKNFQIVLHVKVQGNAPEQPTIVAKYFW